MQYTYVKLLGHGTYLLESCTLGSFTGRSLMRKDSKDPWTVSESELIIKTSSWECTRSL